MGVDSERVLGFRALRVHGQHLAEETPDPEVSHPAKGRSLFFDSAARAAACRALCAPHGGSSGGRVLEMSARIYFQSPTSQNMPEDSLNYPELPEASRHFPKLPKLLSLRYFHFPRGGAQAKSAASRKQGLKT